MCDSHLSPSWIRKAHGTHLEDEGIERNALDFGSAVVLQRVVVRVIVESEAHSRASPACKRGEKQLLQKVVPVRFSWSRTDTKPSVSLLSGSRSGYNDSPALPFLCSALARLIQNSCSLCILHLGSKLISFTFPESTTNLTPSIVTDVSAMFVETMHFLIPSGGKSKT